MSKPLTPRGLELCGSFAEIRREGFEVFSLGPVYVTASIPYSLTREFAHVYKKQKGKEVFGTTMRFERQVIKGFGDWDFVLELLEKEAYPYLCNWLLSNKFVDRENRKYFEIRECSAPIADPIQVDSCRFPDDTYLNVFVPSGLHYMLQPFYLRLPHGAAPTEIEFHQVPPEEDVVRLGRVALSLMEET